MNEGGTNFVDTLPICQAKSKRSGVRCKNCAVKGRRVCYIHGGATPRHNTGPKTREGLHRQHTANLKHGAYSKESKEERQQLAKMVKDAKNFISCL